MLDAMTQSTRLFPVYSRKLSFEASQTPQKDLQLLLMLYCSAVNTAVLVHPGNYVECPEHTLRCLCTQGSAGFFRSFEQVCVSRQQRIGGIRQQHPAFQFPMYFFLFCYRSRSELLLTSPHICLF